ncbi:hypothetical protein Taro_006545 [Colocasia esculenta]|uniref:Uncharacterized protein n=1 Tax=Colocasia esculenta TaxID=4460 RepID=A0A843TT35_COLES|nr:hypothetical protein [Colocasia esculenta]
MGDESAGGSQAPAQQAQDQTGVPLPPPPPPVDYGALLQGLAPAHEAVFGGVPMMERFRRMTPPFFKGESDPILAESLYKAGFRDWKGVFRSGSWRRERGPRMDDFVLVRAGWRLLDHGGVSNFVIRNSPKRRSHDWRRIRAVEVEGKGLPHK